jgi:cytochrome c5
MGQQEDSAFMKTFSLVIFGLVLFTFFIIWIARITGTVELEDINPSRTTLAEERIRPVGAVRTSADELPAQTAVAAVTAPPAATAEPAALDGGAVYQQACVLCHGAGVAGAPMPGSDPWNERAAKGLEQLAYSAINGLNAMPAKGGRPDLSDAEVTAAVEFMMAQ